MKSENLYNGIMHFSKTLLHITILISLFAFTFNLSVKCDGNGIVNIECHSDDCNKSKGNNENCSHCLVVSNTIPVVSSPIIFNNQSEIFYSTNSDSYSFQTSNFIFRPPQA